MLWRCSAATLLAAAVACQPAGPPPGAGVPDDAGRAVQLDRAPRRIVSLSPATTELLFALGAGDRVVGRTRWCEDPPEARQVPSVGDGLAPNVEAIVARRPDLVVFYHASANDAALERLDALGLPSVSVRVDRLADLARTARLLGRLTGDSARADSLIETLDAELAASSVHARPSAPRVLILVWDNPPIVIGGGSFLSEIVELAGGRNAFGDLDRPSATVSIETIAARAPDVVLVTGEGDPGFATRPEWQVVEAVRARRFAAVSGTEFARPSFRAPLAVRRLREVLARWTP